MVFDRALNSMCRRPNGTGKKVPAKSTRKLLYRIRVESTYMKKVDAKKVPAKKYPQIPVPDICRILRGLKKVPAK